MAVISKQLKFATAVACMIVSLITGVTATTAAEKVRVALGDVVSVETLAFIVALERAKDRGVEPATLPCRDDRPYR